MVLLLANDLFSSLAAAGSLMVLVFLVLAAFVAVVSFMGLWSLAMLNRRLKEISKAVTIHTMLAEKRASRQRDRIPPIPDAPAPKSPAEAIETIRYLQGEYEVLRQRFNQGK